MSAPNDPFNQSDPAAPSPFSNPPDPFTKPESAPPAGQAPPPAAGYPPPQQNYPPAPGYPAGGGYPAAPTPGYVGGPAVPPGYYVEPQSGLVLPVGVELATISRRIGGYFLRILLFIVTLVIGYIIWTLISWSRGQSATHRVLKLQVYKPEERRTASWGYMALREIVGGIVEGLVFPIIAIVSLVLANTNPQRRALRDMIAGTVMLYDPNGLMQPRE